VRRSSNVRRRSGEVLRALKSVFGRWRDPAQLSFALEPTPTDGGSLLARLKSLGLTRIARCRLTRNRSVMVSYSGGELRVHESYLAARRDVLQAIVSFVEGRTRAERRNARNRIIAFGGEIPRVSSPRRRERTRPEDAPVAAKLTAWHAKLNLDHFDGA